MSKLVRKWSLIVAVVLGSATYRPVTLADQPASRDQVAIAEQLRTEAVRALSEGKFDRTNELINKAASLSQDPVIVQMSKWVQAYDQQRQTFSSERRKQFEKELASVKKLLDNPEFSTYAIDKLATAYILSDAKADFRKEPWVDSLVKQTAEDAKKAEAEGDWLTTQRLYGDLAGIEPANSEWNDQLTLAQRRTRLMGMYAADDLKKIIEVEIARRDKANGFLEPTTKPVEKPDDTPNDEFRIDWRDQLKGVQFGMVRTALIEARNNYWREVDYKVLMTGGLKGLRALADTKGLEAAFPALNDADKRTKFLAGLDSLLDRAKSATAATDTKLLPITLDGINDLNAQTLSLPEEVIASEFVDGAFAELDPFTNMIWPFDVEEFNKSTQGEFTGVGVQIKLDDHNNLTVVTPIEDSPAYHARMKAGDVITKINDKSARGVTLTQAVKKITGPENTKVKLTVKSLDGEERELELTRRKIEVASLKGWERLATGGWNYFIDADQKIAYLRLTNFTKKSGDELDAAVAQMKKQGAKGLILDLRYNPGGLLTAAAKVADKFLSEGTIVSTKTDPSRDGPTQPPMEATKSDGDLGKDFPVAVLVNQMSASASEIVSGALKDWNRATLVGERTFGKGSVQMLFPMPSRTAYLKLTTSHYYLPAGRCIHHEKNSTTWGVDPDVVVEMTRDQQVAANEARQDQDILSYGGESPTTQPTKKDVLAVDPQLNASLLLLRMKVAPGNAQVAGK